MVFLLEEPTQSRSYRKLKFIPNTEIGKEESTGGMHPEEENKKPRTKKKLDKKTKTKRKKKSSSNSGDKATKKKKKKKDSPSNSRESSSSFQYPSPLEKPKTSINQRQEVQNLLSKVDSLRYACRSEEPMERTSSLNMSQAVPRCHSEGFTASDGSMNSISITKESGVGKVNAFFKIKKKTKKRKSNETLLKVLDNAFWNSHNWEEERALTTEERKAFKLWSR
jgi:hypothetical protein